MIYALLNHAEQKHFSDLYNGGSGFFKMPTEASPVEKRERAIIALESVLPLEKVREQVGTDEVWFLNRGDDAGRWRRI
jgi:hypothetical protein